MFNKSFENITQDVGKELKETARRIYVGGMWFYLILLIIETILVIGGALDNDELFGLVIAIPFAASIEYWIVMGIAHLIAINLYAKGESVHLLRKISEQGKSRDGNSIAHQAAQETFASIVSYDSWLCKECGTQNKKQYGQCKKCGTYRSYETSIEVETPRPQATPAAVAPAPHLDDTWKCWFCGTSNSMKYGQCKKCGKFKNS